MGRRPSLAASAATTALADEDAAHGRRAAPANKPSWEFAAHRLSDERSRRRQLHLGDRRRRSRPAASRGARTTTSRSARARPSSAGPSPAGRSITWELTPLLGGAWGATAGLRARPGGERWPSGRVRLLHRGRIRERSRRPQTAAISTPGASSAFGRSSGFAPASSPSARGPTAASATSSAGRSRRSRWGRVTLGGFWFNPGSSDQVVVVSIGAAFYGMTRPRRLTCPYSSSLNPIRGRQSHRRDQPGRRRTDLRRRRLRACRRPVRGRAGARQDALKASPLLVSF